MNFNLVRFKIGKNRMASCVEKIKAWVRNKLYHEETGFQMNYLTLQISDPVVAKELE